VQRLSCPNPPAVTFLATDLGHASRRQARQKPQRGSSKKILYLLVAATTLLSAGLALATEEAACEANPDKKVLDAAVEAMPDN